MASNKTEWEYLIISEEELSELSGKCTLKKESTNIFKDNVKCSGLNTLGQEGWELVAIEDEKYFFKRAVKYYDTF